MAQLRAALSANTNSSLIALLMLASRQNFVCECKILDTGHIRVVILGKVLSKIVSSIPILDK